MCQALNSKPSAGQRLKKPQPLRWPWIGSCAWRRSRATPAVPTQLRLTMTQLPPSRRDEVVPLEHLVDLAGDVEGEHCLLAGALGVAADHRHHRLDPLRRRGNGADRP